MANEKNLIPNNKRSKAEVREHSRKGGIKSGEVRREQKKFRELFESFLNKKVSVLELNKQLEQFGFKSTEMTNKNAVVLAQYQKALSGDTQAFIAIRDTLGEKPIENVNVNNTTKNPLEDLSTEEIRALIKDDK